MPPQYQQLMEQTQQAQQQLLDISMHAKFLAYSTYVAIILCAIFSILIFWKLCQIHQQLVANAKSQPATPFTRPQMTGSELSPAIQPIPDDSRWIPKK